MKKLLVSLIGAFALGATLPAIAGPDWAVIEWARKAKQEAALAQADQAGLSGPSAKSPGCPPPSLVLPTAHGPRAVTTPAANEIRKARHEARVKACQEAPR